MRILLIGPTGTIGKAIAAALGRRHELSWAGLPMRYPLPFGLPQDLTPARKWGDEIFTSLLAQLRAVSLVLLVGAGGARAQNPPRLTATPVRVLDGDSVSIRATGLAAGARVTIRLQSTSVGDDGAPEPYYST